jgi:hypothetical protein
MHSLDAEVAHAMRHHIAAASVSLSGGNTAAIALAPTPEEHGAASIGASSSDTAAKTAASGPSRHVASASSFSAAVRAGGGGDGGSGDGIPGDDRPRTSSRSESLVPEVTDEEFELHARSQGANQLVGLIDPSNRRSSTALAQRKADGITEASDGQHDDDEREHSSGSVSMSAGCSSSHDQPQGDGVGAKRGARMMPISLPVTPGLAAASPSASPLVQYSPRSHNDNGTATTATTMSMQSVPSMPVVVSAIDAAATESKCFADDLAAALPDAIAANSRTASAVTVSAVPSSINNRDSLLCPLALASPKLDARASLLEHHLPLLGVGNGNGSAPQTTIVPVPSSASFAFATPAAVSSSPPAVAAQTGAHSPKIELQSFAPQPALSRGNTSASNVAATTAAAVTAAASVDALESATSTAVPVPEPIMATSGIAEVRPHIHTASLDSSSSSSISPRDSLISHLPPRPASPLHAALVAAVAAGAAMPSAAPFSSGSGGSDGGLHHHSGSNSHHLHHGGGLHHQHHQHHLHHHHSRRRSLSSRQLKRQLKHSPNGSSNALVQQVQVLSDTSASSSPLIAPGASSAGGSDDALGKMPSHLPSSQGTSASPLGAPVQPVSKGKPCTPSTGTDSKQSSDSSDASASPSCCGNPRRCRWSLPVMFTSLSVLQVVLVCVLVWLLGYLATKDAIDTFTRSIREAVLDACVKQLNDLFAQPVQAAAAIAHLTRLRYGATWPRDLNSFSNRTGWLSDLTHLSTQYPDLQRLGLMNSRGTMHAITKLSALQTSFMAATSLDGDGSEGTTGTGGDGGNVSVQSVDVPPLAEDVTGVQFAFIEPLDLPRGYARMHTYLRADNTTASALNLARQQLYDEQGRPVGFSSSRVTPDIQPDTSAEDIAAYLGPGAVLSNSTYDLVHRPYLQSARDMQRASARAGRPFAQQQGWTEPFQAATYRATTLMATIAAFTAAMAEPVPGDTIDTEASIGVGFALLNLDSLTQKMAALAVGPNGAILVFDVNGKVLVSSRSQPLLTVVGSDGRGGEITSVATNPVPEEQRQWVLPLQAQLRSWALIGPAGSYLTPFNASAAIDSSVRDARFGTSMNLGCGSETHSYTTQARMLDPIITNGLAYTVVLLTRDSDFTSQLNDSIRNTGILSAGIVVAAALLSGLLTRYATAPLRAVCSAMDRTVELMSSPGRGSPEHKAQLVALLAQWNSYSKDGVDPKQGQKAPQPRANRSSSNIHKQSAASPPAAGHASTNTPSWPRDAQQQQSQQPPQTTPNDEGRHLITVEKPTSPPVPYGRSSPSASSAGAVSASAVSSSCSSSLSSSSSSSAPWSARPLLSLLDVASRLEEVLMLRRAFGSMLHSLATHDELEIINKSKRQFIRYIFHEGQPFKHTLAHGRRTWARIGFA